MSISVTRKPNHPLSKKAQQREREAAHRFQKQNDIDAGILRKGWKTPYGFGDFTDHITYEKACEHMKQMSEIIEKWGEENDKTK